MRSTAHTMRRLPTPCACQSCAAPWGGSWGGPPGCLSLNLPFRFAFQPVLWPINVCPCATLAVVKLSAWQKDRLMLGLHAKHQLKFLYGEALPLVPSNCTKPRGLEAHALFRGMTLPPDYMPSSSHTRHTKVSSHDTHHPSMQQSALWLS